MKFEKKRIWLLIALLWPSLIASIPLLLFKDITITSILLSILFYVFPLLYSRFASEHSLTSKIKREIDAIRRGGPPKERKLTYLPHTHHY